MQLRFLGVDTRKEGSPQLYATDESYVVVGWKLPEGDRHRIEIPHGLLAYLERGSCIGTRLEDTGHGTFELSGQPVTDPETLAQMKILDYEQSIVVPKAKEIRPDDAAS
ncbi:hypothetical protein OHB26_03875 [Nocardia sp. NBC_01503]|uniref:hypothetical protein n=1 Tax=Nocardia sp. NBC_01503 TaxID=2975997 RepID=UPI002E7B76FE|nr:hypothetical protein [Nocardia sp. NBC_01503]WTL33395.1 hypothetical protein OHB26_03875 [Nocardia sp. NBC_01503]